MKKRKMLKNQSYYHGRSKQRKVSQGTYERSKQMHGNGMKNGPITECSESKQMSAVLDCSLHSIDDDFTRKTHLLNLLS